MSRKSAKKQSPYKELPSTELKWFCDPESFDFESTSEISPIEEIIGQERALSALELGVNMDKPGYNIYISGLSGTGKATTVQKMLESIGAGKVAIKDYVYVNNFEDPDYPVLLTFKAGQAKDFKKDIRQVMSFLSERIPVHMEAENYRKKRDVIVGKFKAVEWDIFEKFKKKLQVDGFTLKETEDDTDKTPQIIPLINNEPVPITQVIEAADAGKIAPKESKKIINRYENHRQKLITIFHRVMKLNQQMHEELDDLERKEVSVVLDSVLQDTIKKYPDKKIQKYLTEVKESILTNLWIFKKETGENEPGRIEALDAYLRNFEINIVLDNSNTEKRPVIVEISPTLTNLFGSIERIGDGGGKWTADFTTIKAGSLLKANGGYLVIRAVHVFEEAGVWQTLKRVLTYNKLEIQEIYSSHYLPPTSLKPEPIEINTKVILIGNAYWYSLLASNEDDFKKIFKIKVDFDNVVKRSDLMMGEYARVVKRLIQKEGLREFDCSAIAALLEIAARYAEHREKLTTRFSFLADIAREADYWAGKSNATIVTKQYINFAYAKSKERHSLGDEKLTEGILENQILIETEGMRVGCINGLLYFEDESYGFGKPARITASVSIGDGDIVNIERESGLSGRIFDKGMMVVTGYVRELFGRHIPLSFTANFAFEQSYGGIDGDSASTAEILALLSALGEVPLRQCLAVTGSVNQKGEMQPIGGINEKIEGFFEICEKRGLTGEHGVVIPELNVPHLMLHESVVQAVQAGKFHVYPVRTSSAAVTIFTGLPAGERQKNGEFSRHSVFGLVERNLKRMYEIVNSDGEKKKPVNRKK
jgi:ATP-dependent Lon protease